MKWTPIFFQNDFNGHNVLIYFVTIFKSNFYKTLNLDFLIHIHKNKIREI